MNTLLSRITAVAICRLYDSKDYLIHTETELIRGYYRLARPVPRTQLASR